MYQKILNEAIKELKETEFKKTYTKDKSDSFLVEECQIDTDMEILIPDQYVRSVSERLQIYKDLNIIKNQEELNSYQIKIKDRFGSIPVQMKKLFYSIEIKWMAKELGFEKIVLKSNKMIAYFISNPKSSFFESKEFSHILNFIQMNPKTCK